MVEIKWVNVDLLVRIFRALHNVLTRSIVALPAQPILQAKHSEFFQVLPLVTTRNRRDENRIRGRKVVVLDRVDDGHASCIDPVREGFYHMLHVEQERVLEVAAKNVVVAVTGLHFQREILDVASINCFIVRPGGSAKVVSRHADAHALLIKQDDELTVVATETADFQLVMGTVVPTKVRRINCSKEVCVVLNVVGNDNRFGGSHIQFHHVYDITHRKLKIHQQYLLVVTRHDVRELDRILLELVVYSMRMPEVKCLKVGRGRWGFSFSSCLLELILFDLVSLGI